ncbi:chaperone protein DnaK [Pasteurella multocida]|nr:chaperone protein DnaK [Pasteurella multocida]
MALQIGIDLGTTNSLIAQFVDGETRLIPNKLGHYLTPSVISVSDDDRLLVGLSARERLATQPHLSAVAFKRFMGTDKIFKLGKRSFRAEELSAIILKSLKEDAEVFLGEPVEDVVITVPAYFNAIQRQATKAAAQMAGLNVLRLLNEPTAAGLAYNLQEKPDDTRFLIYDLGGGTFDVSILDYFDGVVQVSASAGDNHLGGEDFVQVLSHCFLKNCTTLNEKEYYKIQESNEYWQIFENAKRVLSQSKHVDICLTLDGEQHQAKVTLNEFQQASQSLLFRLRQPLERALRDARLKPNQIEGVILVGGATRMPMIRNMLGQLFQRIPQASINPDEAIARGAAVQAALIARHHCVEEIVLTDVMPFSLGTNIVRYLADGRRIEGQFAPIIERNMPVPVSRVQTFSTVTDNQTQILFEVLQGESPLAKENLRLGEMCIRIPPKPAGEIAIDVRFSYDSNGLLEVDISNQEINLQVSNIFQQNAQNLTDAQIVESRQKLTALKVHPREQEQNIYLLEKAKRLYSEYLGDNRQMISEQMGYFLCALDSQDDTQIRRAQKHFGDFLSRYDSGWLL